METACLLFLLITCATAITFPLGEDFDGHTPRVGADGVSRWAGFIKHHNPKKRSADSFEYHRMSYEAKLLPNVVRLDQADFVQSVQCAQSQRVLTIQFKPGSQWPSSWNQSTVLVGDSSWGCIDASHHEPVGIAVIIQSWSTGSEANTYVVLCQNAAPKDVFEVLSITLEPVDVTPPPQSPQTAQGPLRLISLSSDPVPAEEVETVILTRDLCNIAFLLMCSSTERLHSPPC